MSNKVSFKISIRRKTCLHWSSIWNQ